MSKMHSSVEIEGSGCIDFAKYKLLIFDFDGVIADSLGCYRELDRLVIKDLYDRDVEVSEIEELSERIKTGAINNSEDDYYRCINQKYGNGEGTIDEIRNKIIEFAPIVQAAILPKQGAVKALKGIKQRFAGSIALVTGSSRSDIDFFSTNKTVIGRQLNLNSYFDAIITMDDVTKPKPDPEPFLKAMIMCDVAPESVLIFEDSYSGVLAGKAVGATVVAIEDIHNRRNKEKIIETADYYLENWFQIGI